MTPHITTGVTQQELTVHLHKRECFWRLRMSWRDVGKGNMQMAE